ncbi:MAG TPA: DUF4910 domain-containing protein [Nitrospiraceae bacterium]|nr:DUF4910 domain-containing protein [Nitrospiraceae bacterium]
MTVDAQCRDSSLHGSGEEMYALIKDLYPIGRSITGDGVRRTLEILGRQIPITVHEVPSGTPVFDWVIPQEWNIRDAYIQDRHGHRLVDYRQSNLHVVGYSQPVKKRMRLAELRPHLFSLPDRPDWIPYRTSYYKNDWGFCLSEVQLRRFQDDQDYEVCIDASFTDGHLTYGELALEGEQPEEILLSCHICHPSLCNDNLSGIALAVACAKFLQTIDRRYSYRLLFIPGTIGSITWLSRNEPLTDRIRHGMVLACLGDSGRFTYKKSRRGDAEIDRVVAAVLRDMRAPHDLIDFSPYGYDERQFCSPGFNLPVGCLMRTPHGKFPEYHTSADNLDFVTPAALADSFGVITGVLNILEHNTTYLNLQPKCEPQLGKRGLYRSVGGDQSRSMEMALLWVLNLSDGTHSLFDIAERSALSMTLVHSAAMALVQHGLLKECRAHADQIVTI